MPPQYSFKTNSIAIQTKNNNLQYVSLNSAKFESLLYKFPINTSSWIISDSWLVIPEKVAYYQERESTLSVQLSVKDGETKGNANLSMIVQSQHNISKVITRSTIGALKYSTEIKQNQDNSESISLPESTDGEVVEFNLTDSFKGSISDVEIICPFTIYDKMKISGPLRSRLINANIKSTQRLLNYKTITLALWENSLSIINKAN